MIITLFSTELKNIQTMEDLNRVCTVTQRKVKYAQSRWRGRGCKYNYGRLPLPSGQGLFLVCEETEAHTFKRFEMIICIWKLVTN